MSIPLFSRIKAKYPITLACFAVWMLFFDEKDVFSLLKKRQELHSLEEKIHYYQQANKKTELELSYLDSDPNMLEKYAREKYFMKKDNEDVFLFENTDSTLLKP